MFAEFQSSIMLEEPVWVSEEWVSIMPSQVKKFFWGCVNDIHIEVNWGNFFEVASLLGNYCGSLRGVESLRQHNWGRLIAIASWGGLLSREHLGTLLSLELQLEDLKGNSEYLITFKTVCVFALKDFIRWNWKHNIFCFVEHWFWGGRRRGGD